MSKVEILHAGSGKSLFTLNAAPSTSILELKNQVCEKRKGLYPGRVDLRPKQRGKGYADSDTLASLGLHAGTKLYLKDLGPQIGWVTVFLAEYAGPLVLYLWCFTRPWPLYDAGAAAKPVTTAAKVACACWTIHYAKRLLETLFVHRFSHATMPLSNLFKNCSYYWGFTVFVAYHVNHPLFTPPARPLFITGVVLFTLGELGNLSIHWALRQLRPAGSRVRRIPQPTVNPFTALFSAVSCPNYTYEFVSWLGFTVMTQCVPAGLFTAAGMYQMTVWALGKHRNYKKEFPEYPRGRKAILPGLL
ncbi:very-long-chain enoyl-CoA reductase-like [Amphibalanus amphitrite]|uniref:very-long-chain enoyl-CoA reductase-like n=1 Tax=Amphibalanus amphitrite TaxID=1232801 RepID=UPI001C91E803|nr:very-long-chain enoyl-CoA reductase-like [Amphibalanus amphitrite]